jgi:hypothetical protein
MMESRSGGRGQALKRPPVDKMVRGEDVATKRPIPEDEADERPRQDEPQGIDGTVRERGSWFPGDSTT